MAVQPLPADDTPPLRLSIAVAPSATERSAGALCGVGA